MKHSVKITLILLGMFFITQLIGLAVLNQYAPATQQIIDEKGNIINKTTYNLPYGTDPPEGTNPGANLLSLAIAIAIAVVAMLLLMKYKVEGFLRFWFFIVVILALAITLNAILLDFPYGSYISLIIALPLAFYKIFRRNIIVHNITELLIYPGIAAVLVALLVNVWVAIVALILLSIYDAYAVWHAGFMQKMAKYQIEQLKVFSGFFIPYIGRKERKMLKDLKPEQRKTKKIKVHLAILGGGDVVFPLVLAGTVLHSIGFIQALLVVIGATLALGWLFLMSKKGKFYPAMPFITVGCLIALGIALLI